MGRGCRALLVFPVKKKKERNSRGLSGGFQEPRGGQAGLLWLPRGPPVCPGQGAASRPVPFHCYPPVPAHRHGGDRARRRPRPRLERARPPRLPCGSGSRPRRPPWCRRSASRPAWAMLSTTRAARRDAAAPSEAQGAARSARRPPASFGASPAPRPAVLRGVPGPEEQGWDPGERRQSCAEARGRGGRPPPGRRPRRWHPRHPLLCPNPSRWRGDEGGARSPSGSAVPAPRGSRFRAAEAARPWEPPPRLPRGAQGVNLRANERGGQSGAGRPRRKRKRAEGCGGPGRAGPYPGALRGPAAMHHCRRYRSPEQEPCWGQRWKRRRSRSRAPEGRLRCPPRRDPARRSRSRSRDRTPHRRRYRDRRDSDACRFEERSPSCGEDCCPPRARNCRRSRGREQHRAKQHQHRCRKRRTRSCSSASSMKSSAASAKALSAKLWSASTTPEANPRWH
ncbi:dual specificity protein kinase CLK3 isoform X2 [Cygnus olor]|uniref:dual specificity protein kinase CLK3 isoform X2 n=1 Tax=Cygnus olor TaxID=8869 RepID=UPI001ADE78B5|nr:dual specificity protein kinase CLK3 isoform X2 [Cygnus olor]